MLKSKLSRLNQPNGVNYKFKQTLVRWFVLIGLALPPSLGCQQKSAEQPERAMSVRTQVVSIAPYPHTEYLTGEFRARVQSDLSFRISGRVATRLVDVGAKVKEGDLLATIDSLQQTADVTAAVAAVRSAEATLQQAAANARRIEQLLPTQAATQSEFEDAKAEELTARGSLNISKSVLSRAQSQLSFTELRAPASGVVVARAVEVGQVVIAAQKVFTLAVDGEREAVFDAFQRHVSERPIDDKVQLVLVSNPSVKSAGVIREIAPVIDRNNGTVRVKVAIPEPPEAMTLGAPVMGIAKFVPVNVVQLPWTALARHGDQPAVWVVDSSTQRVSLRDVQIQSYSSGQLLITSGLTTGEVVVVEGTQLIRPGQKIKSLNPDDVQSVPRSPPDSALPKEPIEDQGLDAKGVPKP